MDPFMQNNDGDGDWDNVWG